MRQAAFLTILLSIFLAASAFGDCLSTNTMVKADYVHVWQKIALGVPCDPYITVDSLLEGAARNQIPSYKVQIRENVFLTDQPVTTVQDLVNNRSVLKTYIVNSHGNTSGYIIAFFVTPTGRDLVFNAYPQQWRDNRWVWKYDGDPAPGIFLDGTGIQNLLTPWLDQNFLIGAFFCYSSWTRSYFGIPVNGTQGSTMLGYDDAILMNFSCNDIEEIIRGVGCYKLPEVDGRIDAAMIGTTDYLGLYGNRTNYLNCNVDCKSWAARFVFSEAFDGAFHWATIGEDPGSYYLVSGWRSSGSAPELLASIPGRGSDGHGIIRAYSIPVPPEFLYGEVVEVDGDNVMTASRRFAWGEKPYRWDLIAALDDQQFDVGGSVPQSPTAPVEWIPGDYQEQGAMTLPDADCADVVIVSPLSYLMSWQYFQAKEENTLQGYPVKARSFLVGFDNASIKTALQEVVTANEDYNTQHPELERRYPSDPVLIIVGTPDMVDFARFPNDEWETCRTQQCLSYNLLGDLDGDGIGECPVTLVNADSTFKSERSAGFASDMNHNRFVDPAGHVLLCAGDGYKPGQGNTAMVEELNAVGNAYLASGKPVRALLKESDYSQDYAQMVTDGKEEINAGVRDIWLQGLTTGVDDLTSFVGFGALFRPEELVTKQRIAVLAPTCESGGIWWLDLARQVCTELVFNDPEKTGAAVFVGQLNAAYGQAHRAFREVLLNEVSNAYGVRIPYATIVRNAIVTMNQQYPGYGKGVVCFGSYVLSPGDLSTSAAPETQDRHAVLRLWSSRPTSSSTALHFSLPQDADIDLCVYDVAGRKVAQVKQGRLQAGEYTYSWFHNGQASGVYFTNLKATTQEGGTSKASEKLVIVH